MRLAICYEPSMPAVNDTLCAILCQTFPGLAVGKGPDLSIPPGAWDTNMGHYDAQALLEYLAVPNGCTMALWIVSGDIGDVWRPCIFGAAQERKAIVSMAQLTEVHLLSKEVCHEVGHLLGLCHCSHPCVMQTSWTVQDIRNKPAELCPACRRALEKRILVASGQ